MDGRGFRRRYTSSWPENSIRCQKKTAGEKTKRPWHHKPSRPSFPEIAVDPESSPEPLFSCRRSPPSSRTATRGPWPTKQSDCPHRIPAEPAKENHVFFLSLLFLVGYEVFWI